MTSSGSQEGGAWDKGVLAQVPNLLPGGAGGEVRLFPRRGLEPEVLCSLRQAGPGTQGSLV